MRLSLFRLLFSIVIFIVNLLWPVKPFPHHTGDVLWRIRPPGTAVNYVAGRAALAVEAEKDGNGFHVESGARQAVLPFVNIQADQINTSEGVNQHRVFNSQTGCKYLAGGSPTGIELDERFLSKFQCFLCLLLQQCHQVALRGMQAHDGIALLRCHRR